MTSSMSATQDKWLWMVCFMYVLEGSGLLLSRITSLRTQGMLQICLPVLCGGFMLWAEGRASPAATGGMLVAITLMIWLAIRRERVIRGRPNSPALPAVGSIDLELSLYGMLGVVAIWLCGRGACPAPQFTAVVPYVLFGASWVLVVCAGGRALLGSAWRLPLLWTLRATAACFVLMVALPHAKL